MATTLLIMTLAAFVALVWLEVRLAKSERKAPGLVMPIIFAALALLTSVCFVLFSMNTMTVSGTVTDDELTAAAYDALTDDGEVLVGDIEIEMDDSLAEDPAETKTFPNGAGVFLFTFFPAAVMFAAYFITRAGVKKKRSVDRMAVQDL